MPDEGEPFVLHARLESYIRARWKHPGLLRPREPQGTTPWGASEAPEALAHHYWIVFADRHVPLAVGIRMVNQTWAYQEYDIAQWNPSDSTSDDLTNVSSNRWRFSPSRGWREVDPRI